MARLRGGGASWPVRPDLPVRGHSRSRQGPAPEGCENPSLTGGPSGVVLGGYPEDSDMGRYCFEYVSYLYRMTAENANTRSTWRKSSRSVGNGACVEVGADGQIIKIRDTAALEDPGLRCSVRSWRTFIGAVKARNIDTSLRAEHRQSDLQAPDGRPRGEAMRTVADRLGHLRADPGRHRQSRASKRPSPVGCAGEEGRLPTQGKVVKSADVVQW